jgi:hypothetical protein
VLDDKAPGLYEHVYVSLFLEAGRTACGDDLAIGRIDRFTRPGFDIECRIQHLEAPIALRCREEKRCRAEVDAPERVLSCITIGAKALLRPRIGGDGSDSCFGDLLLKFAFEHVVPPPHHGCCLAPGDEHLSDDLGTITG